MCPIISPRIVGTCKGSQRLRIPAGQIVITTSGQEPAVVQIIREARNAHVTVISLTDQCANPVLVLEDIRAYGVSRGD